MELPKKPSPVQMINPLVYARTAGLLYLTLLPLGIFGIMYGPSVLIVSGDAMSTVKNLTASETLFRLSIVTNLVLHLISIFLVLILYKLLKPVNNNHAVLMVILLLVGIPIAMINVITQFAALLLLSGAEYLAVFKEDQLQALILFFLKLHGQGYIIAQIFWGLWLLPLGLLVYKSNFLPRILGILLMIGCLGYLIDSFAVILYPSFFLISKYTFIGELILILWLLIKGVNIEQWKKRALHIA